MEERDLTTDVWRIDAEEFPADAPLAERARFLLRYAILAPSSHNSQPWEFVVEDGRIEIHAVEERWLEAADPDNRELYVSLGCAVENLCIAAEQFGFDFEIAYHDDAVPVVVMLRPDSDTSSHRPPDLFAQITDRSTNHQLFRDESLGDSVRDELRDCVLEDDVTLELIDDSERKGSIAALQAEADRLQMDHPDYREELGYWMGIGALGDSWLKARIGQAVVTHLDIGDREAKKNSKLIQSTPVVGVLTTNSDDPSARVKTGRVFERAALIMSSNGGAVHPMSQILERPEMREDLASVLDGDGELPQQLFRLGYPQEEQGHTPRWPLEKFLVE
ncbi:Acg family FMN-binding oxidoreductase [Halosolutus halophilus]|uniref:Acg family FMN-binding oxidoreductase n=1 Tax=Halosolutus halophilus TaxID=1552990 RepID=UPI002234F11B|nr:nitroreductase [Halosolutus halophilus]